MKKFTSLISLVIGCSILLTGHSIKASEIIVPQENIIDNIISVCKYNSVSKEETVEGKRYPYGKETDQCLEKVAELCRTAKLNNVTKTENYVFADYNRDADGTTDTVGILGHIDIVPSDAGDDEDKWVVDPFFGDGQTITQWDGKDVLVGRGVLDDKGPMIICLNVLREMKEQGIELKSNVRLIFGPDEETGKWEGIEQHYIPENGKPKIGFSPDAHFPVCNQETGMLHVILTADNTKHVVYGGKGRTFVPDTAYYDGTVEENRKIMAAANELKNTEIEHNKFKAVVLGVNEMSRIKITTTGASSSEPKNGDNAITFLCKAMYKAGINSDTINYINNVFPSWDGKALMGNEFEDHHFTCNVAVAGKDDNGNQYFELDIKTPWDKKQSASDTKANIIVESDIYNHSIEIPIYFDELYVPDDNELVQTLMNSYIKNTGDSDAKTASIVGSTYSKCMYEDGVCDFVSYGPYFEGDKDLIHKANERMEIEKMHTMYKIYYDAILKLAEVKENTTKAL